MGIEIIPNVFLDYLIYWALGTGVVGSVIFTAAEFAKHKPVKKATHADYYVEPQNVDMRVTTDQFLRTRETKIRIRSSNSGGNRGRGGGRRR